MILLDTDILVDATRNINNAINCLQKAKKLQLALSVSSVTQMELIIGCRDKNELQALGHFLREKQNLITVCRGSCFL
jgi:predicted nucleic acid-binding protein